MKPKGYNIWIGVLVLLLLVCFFLSVYWFNNYSLRSNQLEECVNITSDWNKSYYETIDFYNEVLDNQTIFYLVQCLDYFGYNESIPYEINLAWYTCSYIINQSEFVRRYNSSIV